MKDQTPEQIVEEARRIQARDLERAKSALQGANACGHFDGVCYRIARVELDCPPPLPMIVDVRSSDLDGPRLPEPPLIDVDIYTPPEERGSVRPLFARNARSDDVTLVVEKADGSVAVHPGLALEVGEHHFEEGSPFCADCGCTLTHAVWRQRCGA
jgi:hypothetical protein